MIRFLIVFLLIFFSAFLLAVLVEKDAGFVLLSYDNHFFRTNIWIFALLFLITFLAFICFDPSYAFCLSIIYK